MESVSNTQHGRSSRVLRCNILLCGMNGGQPKTKSVRRIELLQSQKLAWEYSFGNDKIPESTCCSCLVPESQHRGRWVKFAGKLQNSTFIGAREAITLLKSTDK